MEIQPGWTENYYIGAYDVDINRNVKLSRLMGYMQETAWWHASHLNLGDEYLHKNGLVWILSAIKIHVDKLPAWKDNITIETWPRGINRLYYLRDFIVRDFDNNIIGMASTNWLLVDLKSKRPKIIETESLKEVINPDKKVFEDEIRKLPSVNSGDIYNRQIHTTDIDLNQHLSSNRYADIIMDCFNYDFHKTHQIVDFQINYLKEVKPGEIINMSKQEIQKDAMYAFEGKSEKGDVLHFQVWTNFVNT